MSGADTAVVSCPFCVSAQSDSGSVLERGLFSAVLSDGFPVAAGHVLVVPLRHVARLTELDAAERFDLMSLVFSRVALAEQVSDAVSVGVNDGPAAGQTVPHVHVHVIPRIAGDVPDPRGGIRMLFPAGRYWE